MDPRTDKLIRRTAMTGAVIAAYFLLAAEYGPQYNALDPVKNAFKSAEFSIKRFVFGTGKEANQSEEEKT